MSDLKSATTAVTSTPPATVAPAPPFATSASATTTTPAAPALEVRSQSRQVQRGAFTFLEPHDRTAIQLNLYFFKHRDRLNRARRLQLLQPE